MHTMGPGGQIELGLLVLASVLIALLAYRGKVLDPGGSALAFLISFLVGVLGHWSWLFLLLAFVAGSFLVTRFAFAYKVRMGVEEAHGGVRGGANVIANGAVPALVAVAFTQADLTGYTLLSETQALVAFTAALAAAAADTFASEVGVLNDHPVSILNWRQRLPPGTDGGVSPVGTLAAAMAALCMTLIAITTFAGLDLLNGTRREFLFYIFLPSAAGFIGCQTDSLLGLTLERRGWLGNGGVNFIAITSSTLLALLLLTLS